MHLHVLLFLSCTGLSTAATFYTPQRATCPSSPLVRIASGISDDENFYFTARRSKAATALAAWLDKVAPSISAPQDSYPVIGLTTSGGGLRSLLTGAGVHQAFDARDSDTSTSGLYQALSYESGLSGGGWLLSSIASNNWPTISSLQSGLWNQAFNDTLANPPHFPLVKIGLAQDMLGKAGAGFNVGVTDIYGRLLGYQLLYGEDGGIKHLLSDMTNLGNFTSHNVPYPILTALNTPPGSLLPPFKGLQIEFHPFEYGSWDKGIAAFSTTKYMGSSLSNGKPIKSNQCFTRFDSQCFVLGTSSSIFSALVAEGLKSLSEVKQLVNALKQVGLPTKSQDIYFAQYPNPFYKYPHSSAVQDQEELNLIDGGNDHPDQGDPIWPMLHREVDVLIVSANSADTAKNFPSGVEIHNTYIRAQQASLSRMPLIPDKQTFASQGLLNRSTFFGCYNDSVMTIVYMPNREISYNSGVSTLDIKYTPSQTAAMIKNGMQIATESGDSQWGFCLACAIMKKSQGATLPSGCTACYKKYCYGKYVAKDAGSTGGSGSGGSGSGGSGSGGSGSGGSGSGGSGSAGSGTGNTGSLVRSPPTSSIVGFGIFWTMGLLLLS